MKTYVFTPPQVVYLRAAADKSGPVHSLMFPQEACI
jgi:hypothetical protein